MEFLKLLVPLLLVPANYDQMRQKLAAFAFYEVWLATWIIRTVPQVSSRVKALEAAIIPGPLIKIAPWLHDINMSGLLLAAAIALVTYIFHFHDRISDLLLLRKTFDRTQILEPLAKLVGTKLERVDLKKLDTNHDRIMRNVFYKYTSSTAYNPLVDKHDISQALDAWAWYWISLEGTVIWLCVGLIGVYFHSDLISYTGFCALVLCLLIQFALRPFLRRRARAQIEAIADNAQAKKEVKAYINAL